MMLTKEQPKDFLYLIWKSEKTRRQYIIGQLSKNTHYEFEYGNDVAEAQKDGFTPLISFPNLEGIYCSNKMFPSFESRLPDPKRKDMDKILERYGMDSFDSYLMLKKSGGRLPIDRLYFVDPIHETDEAFSKTFYMAGARHYIGCKGEHCDKSLEIETGEKVQFELEPDNEKDSKAVKVLNSKGQMLGYVPRYYSDSLFDLIQKGRSVKCTVINVDKNKSCDECIKLLLEVE